EAGTAYDEFFGYQAPEWYDTDGKWLGGPEFASAAALRQEQAANQGAPAATAAIAFPWISTALGAAAAAEPGVRLTGSRPVVFNGLNQPSAQPGDEAGFPSSLACFFAQRRRRFLTCPIPHSTSSRPWPRSLPLN